MKKSEIIVQRQLDAYNAHNLSQFSECFSEQVLVYRHSEQVPVFNNKGDMLTFYQNNRFNQPLLHAKLLNRMVIGDKVLDHELVTGLADEDKEVVAIYQIDNQLISRVWFVDP